MPQHGVAIHNKKVDSRANDHFVIRVRDSGVAIHSAPLSSRALKGVAIHKSAKVDSSEVNSASAECMDCHAIATALARNDDKKVDSSTATILKQSAKDSRSLELESAFGVASSQAEAKLDSRNEAQNLKTPAQDSRILEIESGFFKPRKEIRLGCLSTQRGDEIRDSSPKAKSSKQQLMPKLARAS